MTFVKHSCFRFLIKWVIVSLFNVKAVQVSGTRKAFDWTSNAYVRYDAESVVQCLDSLSEQDGDQLPHRHFVFMGDSRIRHLFYSFTQMFADYDLRWTNTIWREFAYHHDVSVSSFLLNTTITFKWSPYIEDGLDQLVLWTSTWHSSTPTFLILGVAAWYIDNEKVRKDPLEDFEKSLNFVVPLLKQLTRSSKVLWLNQFPLAERLNEPFCLKCHQTTIERYNIAARKVLRSVQLNHYTTSSFTTNSNYSGTGVLFWDSDTGIGIEYIRSCSLNRQRDDSLEYRHCPDYLHTGYVVLDYRSQLLMNFICNQ